jgi:hypothetical protein
VLKHTAISKRHSRHILLYILNILSYKLLKIIECRFIKVDFEDKVTWKLETDYLRCSPKFHGHARYDCVIFLDHDNHCSFARLVFVFVCEVLGQTVPMALVQPADMGLEGRPRVVDLDLGLHRLKMRKRTDCRFIPLRSVVRGALLVQDSKNHNEYIVVDTIDGDMFLRVQDLFPKSYTS